jgi:hypothetical protein
MIWNKSDTSHIRLAITVIYSNKIIVKIIIMNTSIAVSDAHTTPIPLFWHKTLHDF